MATDFERDLAAGGVVIEDEMTDFDRDLELGGVEITDDEVGGTMPFLNKSIADTVGAPVDFVTSALNLIPGVDISDPIGGSAHLSKAFEGLGVQMPSKEATPQTAGEQIGSAVGEIAALTIPSTAAIKTATTGAGLASRVAAPIWQSMLKHPGLFATAELTSGVGVGVARKAGEDIESPTVRSALEIGGGVLGGLLPTTAVHTPLTLTSRLLRKGVPAAAQKISLPFTERGAKFRAGEFVKKQVSAPEDVARRLEEETIGELPPTVRAGEKRLNALSAQIRNSDPVADADFIEQTGRSAQKLSNELRKVGTGTAEQMKEITRKRVDAIQLGMDKRTLNASKRAQDKLAKLTPAKRKSAESRIVREELDNVLSAERANERALWAEVPKETKVSYSGARTEYQRILNDTPEAQISDIPAIAKRSFLSGKKPAADVALGAERARFGALTGEAVPEATETTINEAWGLRSKLLEHSRKSKAAGNFNSARIADELSDALLTDMGASATGSNQLEVALAQSRHINERFRRGIVGKILGQQKTGAPQISPDLTLDVSIGRAGAKGAVDIDNVLVTPESVAAAERYVTRSFTDFATDKATNNIIPTKAQNWIRNNDEILDKFPDLKRSLSDATEAQRIADSTRITMEARKARLQNPRISNAARILNTDLGREMDAVFKSSNPEREINSMLALARKDKTGSAIEGIRGSLTDYIIEKASSNTFNEAGEQMLSGKSLSSILNNKKYTNVISKVYTPEQASRVRRIAGELSRLEAVEAKQSGIPIELDDIASNGLRLFSRVGGAQVGRWVAKITGGGTVQTPGIFSERFKNFAQHLTKDRAFQLIHDAVTSESDDLLKALLLPIDKPTSPSAFKNIRILNHRINLWLLGSGERVYNDIQEDINNEQALELQEREGAPTF